MERDKIRNEIWELPRTRLKRQKQQRLFTRKGV
jgi:hypothetical protein